MPVIWTNIILANWFYRMHKNVLWFMQRETNFVCKIYETLNGKDLYGEHQPGGVSVPDLSLFNNLRKMHCKPLNCINQYNQLSLAFCQIICHFDNPCHSNIYWLLSPITMLFFFFHLLLQYFISVLKKRFQYSFLPINTLFCWNFRTVEWKWLKFSATKYWRNSKHYLREAMWHYDVKCNKIIQLKFMNWAS